MKPRKTPIYMGMLLMAAIVVLCGWMGIEVDNGEPFSFLAVSRGGTETIRFWEKEPGACYVFLPSGMELDHLHISTQKTVRIGQRQMWRGRSCKGLEWETTYDLSGAEGLNTITFLRSENVGAMFLDTRSGSMEQIHASKGHQESGELRLYDEQGRRNYRGEIEAVKGHGNSTFSNHHDKKPYNVKLRTGADLLNMGEAKKWILLSNLYDSSHLKNKLVFDFAKEAGLPYSPDSRWVDLYLNGSYAGLYLLCEKNEIDPQRVNISETAGFLISKDKGDRLAEQGIPHFVTDAGVPLRIHSCTVGEENMKALVQAAENAMLAPDGRDPETGKHWTEYIDLDSWARKYLVEEIFGGGDAGHYSQYFYYEGDGTAGKIYAGPVWDYDITMGIDGNGPNLFYAHREHISPWFHALYYTPEFFSRVMALYKEELDPLLKIWVEEKIPAYEAFTRQAARLNSLRWFGDAEQEAARMQHYMAGRRKFLQDVWIRRRAYAEVAVVDAGNVLEYADLLALVQGENLTGVENWQSYDWYRWETGEPWDMAVPVFEDMIVFAKEKASEDGIPPAEQE